MESSTSQLLKTKVKVGSDELEIVTIFYEEEEVAEETGRVLVYVFKPSFDEDLFTPEITIDGESKDVEWGEYVYFEDLTAGEEYEVDVESVEIDDDTYKPVLSTDEIKVKEDKVAYVIVKYVKK